LSFTRRFFRRVTEAETLPSYLLLQLFLFFCSKSAKFDGIKKIHPSKREKAARKSLTAALLGRVFYSVFCRQHFNRYIRGMQVIFIFSLISFLTNLSSFFRNISQF